MIATGPLMLEAVQTIEFKDVQPVRLRQGQSAHYRLRVENTLPYPVVVAALNYVVLKEAEDA